MSITLLIILCIVMVLLICMSAYFSSSEIVYLTTNRLRLKKEVDQGDKRSKLAYELSENYTDTLSTILVGNNIVNIAFSSIATMIAIEFWGEVTGATIATIGATMLILVFGEILPKTISPKYSFSLSKLFAKLLHFLGYVFFPLIFVLSKIVNFLTKPWKKHIENNNSAEHDVTDELNTIAGEMAEDGVFDKEDALLVKNAIDFCDATAHEIMQPRVDVFAFDIDGDIQELLSDSRIYKYSRVPVYHETIDNIIGILSTTNLVKRILNQEVVDIRSLLTKPIFVHMTKSAAAILKELKESHSHMAIVIDQYGGVMGILTTEDLLEELVGDIWDESDDVLPEYTEISENTYLVDADMNIHDFFELVGYNDRDFETEYTTLGGWCTEILEKFPVANDTFAFDNLTMTITKTDKMRVTEVEVVVRPEVSEE